LRIRYTPTIGILLVALCLFGVINRLITPGSNSTSASGSAVPSPTDRAAIVKAIMGATDPLITEATCGDPKTARVRVQVGFTAGDWLANNTNAEYQLARGLAEWVGSDPNLSAQLVCVDIPPEYRSDPTTVRIPIGITVNGKPLPGVRGDMGKGEINPDQVLALLHEMGWRLRHGSTAG
jgi:hypothetical protein